MGRAGRTIERPGGRGQPAIRRQDGDSWQSGSHGRGSVLLVGTGEDGALAPPAVRGRAPKARLDP